MGTVCPSGRVVFTDAAVRLTVCAVAGGPVTRRAAATSPKRMWAVLFFDSCIWSPTFSIRFVDLEAARINQHHHHHAARKHVVRRDLALVVRVPHVGESLFTAQTTRVCDGAGWRNGR